MPINAAMTALLHELSEEIPDVLTETFTFAALWADLCRVAGEPVPADVAAALDAPLDLAPAFPAPEVRRGSFLGHAAQFPEAYALPRGDLTITDILRNCPHPSTGRGR